MISISCRNYFAITWFRIVCIANKLISVVFYSITIFTSVTVSSRNRNLHTILKISFNQNIHTLCIIDIYSILTRVSTTHFIISFTSLAKGLICGLNSLTIRHLANLLTYTTLINHSRFIACFTSTANWVPF